MAERLTEAAVKAAKPEPDKRQTIIFDAHNDAPKGFGLRIMPTGRKAFVLRFKQGGKDRLVTIGQYPTWSLTAAREEARERRRSLDRGIDPDEAKREQREAEAAAARREAQARESSLMHLMRDYCEHLRAQGKNTGGVYSAIKCHIDIPELADITSLPASAIRPEHIARIVRRIFNQGKERTAGITRAYLSAAFSMAWRAPYSPAIPEHFAAYGVEQNPVAPIATVPVGRGQRVLTDAEMGAWFAILKPDHPSDRPLLLALLAGGQRLRQIMRARVRDWDARHQTLRLWDGKGRRREPREHLLPLAPQGAALVQRILTENHQTAPDAPLFPAALPAVASRAFRQTRRITPGDPFNLQDIRRSVETRLASLGISRDTRAQLLSHGLSGVQQAHYDRHQYLDEKRAALVAWEAHLAELAAAFSTNGAKSEKRPDSAANPSNPPANPVDSGNVPTGHKSAKRPDSRISSNGTNSGNIPDSASPAPLAAREGA